MLVETTAQIDCLNRAAPLVLRNDVGTEKAEFPIIQHGVRFVTNGDDRSEPSPPQLTIDFHRDVVDVVGRGVVAGRRVRIVIVDWIFGIIAHARRVSQIVQVIC